jgi:hypothetical protein
LGFGAAEAGDGLLGGLGVERVRSGAFFCFYGGMGLWYVCDDVDLECEGEHVGVETSLGELGGLLRALGLLEDGLERLQGVLDLDDGGVVDGVRQCGGVKRSFLLKLFVG